MFNFYLTKSYIEQWKENNKITAIIKCNSQNVWYEDLNIDDYIPHDLVSDIIKSKTETTTMIKYKPTYMNDKSKIYKITLKIEFKQYNVIIYLEHDEYNPLL